MQKYLEKSSMFHEDLFTVVVLRRPVASSLLLCVNTGQVGCKIQIEMDWMGFISSGKNIKISFVSSSVLIVLFSQSYQSSVT